MSHIAELLPLVATWAEKYVSLLYNQCPLVRVAGADEGYIENQIRFLSHYVLMMQLGNEISQKDRIKKFLDMQYALTSEKIQLNFIGGAPFDVCVLANSIEEIDIADILGIAGFCDIIMYRLDSSKWVKKNIDAIKKKIIEDLEFDGYEALIDVGSVAGSDLEIHLEITEDSPIAYIRIVKSFNQIKKLHNKLLLKLATSDDFQVRSAVAGMKFINKNIVNMLLKDQEVDVLLSLFSNTKALALVSKANTFARLGYISKKLRKKRIKNPVEIAKGFYYTYEHAVRDEPDCQETEYKQWHSLIDSPDFVPILKSIGNAVQFASPSYNLLSAFRSDLIYLNDNELVSDWIEAWIEELQELQELD